MDLKELGMRFALGYLMNRASGASVKRAAIDSSIGSTIAQAREDITGFTPEVADVTTQVVSDLVAAKRAKELELPVAAVPDVNDGDVENLKSQVTDGRVGVSGEQLEKEVTELHEGITEGYRKLLDLERLKAGVLKRD